MVPTFFVLEFDRGQSLSYFRLLVEFASSLQLQGQRTVCHLVDLPALLQGLTDLRAAFRALYTAQSFGDSKPNSGASDLRRRRKKTLRWVEYISDSNDIGKQI